MKQLSIISLVALTLILTACKKDADNSLYPDLLSQVQNNYTLESELDEVLITFINSLSGAEHSVGVSDNPNFGHFSDMPEYDIFISGASDKSLKINVDGQEYSANERGRWLRSDARLKLLYGKTVTIQMQDDRTTSNYSMYVPKPALVQKLGAPRSNEISRTGNTLKWTPDPNNTYGKVLMICRLFNTSGFGEPNNGSTASKYYLLDDDGEYSLDNILADPSAKRINFMLVTGNAVAFESNGVKTVFDIRCTDSHEYEIVD